MSSRRFKRKLAHFWEAYRVVFLTMLGVCALGWLYYFLTTIGPDRAKTDAESAEAVARLDDGVLQARVEEINQLERVYQQAAAADLITDEALAALEQAVEKQRELIRQYPNGDYARSTRLSTLETKLDSARASRLVDKIAQMQKDGEVAMRDGRHDEAVQLFEQALRMQRDINSSNASARYKNFVRETALLQSIAAVAAAPLNQEKEASLAAAKLAVGEERWADALAAYVRARDLQGRINREYSRTRYADLAAYDRLDSEIASLNSAGVAAGVDAKEKTGDEAAAAGRHDEAARLYAEASALQQEINLQYSRSRFVSSARLDRLETKQQTAKAQPSYEKLKGLDAQITSDLGARRVVAAEQRIPEASALLERISTEYPKSDYQLGTLKIRLAYLALKREELRDLQDTVYDQLLPMPSVANELLYKTEVPQSLYARVMNTNPSRNPGRALPVDSVNWSDAAEFCTRMGWLLGLPVRVPTVDEFRIAVGDSLGGIVSADSGGNRTMPVDEGAANINGFHSLVGNVAEWLYVTSGTTAPVSGGSYLDREATLRTLPIENRPRIDRARHIGFRFVVLQRAGVDS